MKINVGKQQLLTCLGVLFTVGGAIVGSLKSDADKGEIAEMAAKIVEEKNSNKQS